MLFSFRKSKRDIKSNLWGPLIITWWFAICLIIVLSCFWYKYNDLAAHALFTDARITELHPEIHNTVNYEFTISGKTYQGVGTGADKIPTPWPKMKIYFDARDPSNSIAENPASQARTVAISIVCVAALGVLVSALILRRPSKPL